jgi:uncharacterized membrane protein HdeD (DUF308 family)
VTARRTVFELSTVTKVVPPLCLILGLIAFVAGFALLAVERPQPSIELHQARVQGDEEYRELLEDELQQRRLWRNVLIGALFTCGVLFAAAGFLAMQPARPPHDARLRVGTSDRQEHGSGGGTPVE